MTMIFLLFTILSSFSVNFVEVVTDPGDHEHVLAITSKEHQIHKQIMLLILLIVN